MIRLLLLFSLLIGSSSCNADEQPKPLTPMQIKQIAMYCKVWGFLKYYHPAVSDGKLNWDSLFLQYYPKIKSAQSISEFNNSLLELCQQAESKKDNWSHNTFSPKSDEEISISDFSWIDDRSVLTEPVVKFLHKVKDEFKPAYNKYISSVTGAGNPAFSGDNEFSKDTNNYPEVAIRALTVSRFWNIINYFYPYKNIIGIPWDSALFEHLPRIIAAHDTLTYQLAALQLYKSINDGHAFTNAFWAGNYLGAAFIPIVVSDVDGKPVITNGIDPQTNKGDSVLAALGLKKGDILLKINGKDADSLRKIYLKYVPGSNPPGKMRNATSYVVRGKPNSIAIMTISDGMNAREISTSFRTHLPFDGWHAKDKEGVWKILEGNIGYVDMGILNPGQVERMMKDIGNTKGIVFDVRNYPHGSMYEIGKYLGKIRPFAYFTMPDVTNPGYLYKTDKNMMTCGENEVYHGKITILVNEQTQSHAEFTVMSLQVVPGAKTFGRALLNPCKKE